ncbi:MAG: hypothetical protein K2K55_06115, partial [Duncaniella sp.]|nr:hypothetical protein [Duncaniella sp.]
YLGNNRAVVRASTGVADQVTHYYPWGSVYGDLGSGASLQPFKYGDKELDLSNGIARYDYSARAYFPSIPRFASPDRYADTYSYITPYAFCGNNPVNITDPTGNTITQMIDDEKYWYRKDKEGNWGFYNAAGVRYTGTQSCAEHLDLIRNSDESLANMIEILVDSEYETEIQYITDSSKEEPHNGSKVRFGKTYTGYSIIKYAPQNWKGMIGFDFLTGYESYVQDPAGILAHELGHTFSRIMEGNLTKLILQSRQSPLVAIQDEVISCLVENIVRKSEGEPVRISYYYGNKSGKMTIDGGTPLRFTLDDYLLFKQLTQIR